MDKVHYIKELAKIAADYDLTTLKVTDENAVTVEITRERTKSESSGVVTLDVIKSVDDFPPNPKSSATAHHEPEHASVSEETAHETNPASHEVKSPMVGVFYSSPKPGDPPFVKVGDTVNIGDVLCIIEAMKIMNEIKAEISGTVTEICVNDADLVEFGQPIFRIG